jgi:hypothetical protein
MSFKAVKNTERFLPVSAAAMLLFYHVYEQNRNPKSPATKFSAALGGGGDEIDFL